MPNWGSSVPTGAAVVACLACLACSGSDDESSSADDGHNVDFAVSCSLPVACGGDPIGEWNVVGGCVEPSGEDFDCDWEATAYGTITGTVEISSGGYSLDTDAELRHCGWVDGSGRGVGGSAVVMDNTIVLADRTLAFCVEGDTLSLWDMAAVYPSFSVLKLERP
jgi:hypothetical protein